MRGVRALGLTVAVLMTAAIGYGFATGSGFGEEGSQLLGLSWGRVTLVDLYLMLGVFAVWVWRREENKAVALMWTIALMGLGSVAAGAYLFLATPTVPPEES
jgi:hypothetical protein